MRVNIYTFSGIRGMKRKNGTIWYILEAVTEKGNATAGDKVKLEAVTGNQSELQALLLAARRLKKESEVHIYTESSFVAAGWTQGWIRNWQKNHWKTAKGEPVAFEEMWRELEQLLLRHHVEFHVKEQHSFRTWFESEARRDG